MLSQHQLGKPNQTKPNQTKPNHDNNCEHYLFYCDNLLDEGRLDQKFNPPPFEGLCEYHTFQDERKVSMLGGLVYYIYKEVLGQLILSAAYFIILLLLLLLLELWMSQSIPFYWYRNCYLIVLWNGRFVRPGTTKVVHDKEMGAWNGSATAAGLVADCWQIWCVVLYNILPMILAEVTLNIHRVFCCANYKS